MSNANGIPTTLLRTWFAAAGTGRRVLTTPVAVTLVVELFNAFA